MRPGSEGIVRGTLEVSAGRAQGGNDRGEMIVNRSFSLPVFVLVHTCPLLSFVPIQRLSRSCYCKVTYFKHLERGEQGI